MELFVYYPWLFPLFATILGLIVGSFLNVVIYRLPRIMERDWHAECYDCFPDQMTAPPQETFNLSYPASTCPQCDSKIKFYDNIPVISWLLLRGKCRQCSNPISVRYPLIELLTGAMALTIALYLPASYWSYAVIGFSFVLVALTFIDFDTQLLPDQLTLPLMWAGIATALLGWAPHSLQDAVVGAMAGYLSLWSVYWLFKLITKKEGMGYGDFKLLAALGAWLGWQMLPMVILLSSVLGAVFGIIQLRLAGQDNQTPFSFGPYLAIAGWIAILWGDNITHWYFTSILGF
ncbi:prepilin peptidase [Thaumasiovibrio subtropicus]|uniref:prepilin peptidase n=1 Tax=Thaumasiovibrio subtropicus TaxID=1891207 RepID=UPI000B35F8DD|nr:A24 family peptidase [Thaumasiovibrio subtropicus]